MSKEVIFYWRAQANVYIYPPNKDMIIKNYSLLKILTYSQEEIEDIFLC